MMARFKAWLKKWWWVLVLVMVSVGGLVLYLLLRKRPKPAPSETFSNKARKEILKAETEAVIEREKVKAKSGAERARLEEIGKTEDDFARRKRLADYLDENL